MRIIQNLNNIFDQYSQEENKLTHALLHTISSDKKVFKDFIIFIIKTFPFDRKSTVFVGSQGKIDEHHLSQNVRKHKGDSIPDGILYDDKWSACILIENKVTASINTKQIDSHLKLIQRYGVKKPFLLLLTTDRGFSKKLISAFERRGAKVFWKPWWEVYQWAGKYLKSDIINSFREYMEIMELVIIERNASWEGIMTKFSGIPFNEDEPYAYNRAKWCLNSFMNELRNHKQLKKTYNLGSTKGRGKITGTSLSSVWDLIPLTKKKAGRFTEHPHITFGTRQGFTNIQITLPNNAKSAYWNALADRGKEGLRTMLLEIHQNLLKGMPRKPTKLKLLVEILHRHYPYLNHPGIKDGEMYFNVDCLSEKKKIDPKVKTFTSWLDALDVTLAQRKKANFQIAIAVHYYHKKGSIVEKPEFVDEAVRALIALKPFYEKITTS